MRVLLVQADNPYRAITAQWLSMLNGVSAVQIAGSGSVAMTLIDSMGPDVILVDAALPDMDGFEFTRKAKSNGGTYRLVMMIAVRSSRFEESARKAGADHAVEKSALHMMLPALMAECASLARGPSRKPS
jgi:DNA-binding response OmpR family regulator